MVVRCRLAARPSGCKHRSNADLRIVADTALKLRTTPISTTSVDNATQRFNYANITDRCRGRDRMHTGTSFGEHPRCRGV